MSTRLLLHLTLFTALLLTACASQLDSPANPSQPTPSVSKEDLPFMSPTDSNSAISPEPASTSQVTDSIPTSITPDELQKKITELAVADLATRLALDSELISLVSAKSVTWPNAALGCPQPEKVYAQGTVSGFLIKLMAMGTEYIYHTDRKGTIVQCPQENSDNPDRPTNPIYPGDTLGGQIP